MDANWVQQAQILIRHYLHCRPADDIDAMLTQYAEALWMEKRVMEVMAAAVARAFNGK